MVFPVILHILVTMILGIFLLKQNRGLHEIDLALTLKIGYVKGRAILFIIPGFVTDLLGLMLFFKCSVLFSGDTFGIQQRNLFIKIRKIIMKK